MNETWIARIESAVGRFTGWWLCGNIPRLFINDPFATGGPANEWSLWRQTKLGNRVSIGTNAAILPVTICDGVIIGAGAVVTKDITEAGFYVGNPARLLRPL